MATRKASNRAHNKKLRRRQEGLSTKCFEYGELDGAELALFIRYPKRGEFYSYISNPRLPWLKDVPAMVRHEFDGIVKTLLIFNCCQILKLK